MRLLFKRQLPLFTSSFTSSRPLSGSNLITTPIFYVNAKPHIGHLYSAVLADVLKRWSVFRRVPCFLSTGTDEHGLKIQEASAKAGVDPGTFCASVSESFRGLFDRGNVSYDDYIRTAEPRHYAAVQHLWKKLEKSGYIYKGVHEGWYSISDETFFPETQVEKQFKKDGSTQMISKETGKVVEWSSEQNYKFRLSAFKEFLREWLKSNPEVIYPKAQYLNVLRAVEGDNALSDISVSRPSSRLQWGIPVPQDPSQVIYVWLDALTNYLTVTGYPWESRNEEVKAVAWPPKYHIVGKDIIKFHAIYWPAFLLAAGLELPQKIICHSHWLHNNEKMSKSLGNVVDPDELLKTYGSDVTRYFFIRDGSIEHDSEFSWASIDKRYRELGIHLGNLLSRCSGKKVNSNGSVPIVDFKSLDSEASIIMERCTSLRG
ncbi:Methionyl/Leucyl tRNA synthetase [Chytridium lagenaria]|nr:Methionyl/Leucyl tRNA synthetase [Chytridium lagenaria]